MVLYFITGNKGKFEEVKSILGDVEQIELDLPEVQSLDPKEVIEAKLQEARKMHEGDFIVEDTGIYLDCLNGFPGPLIKWLMESVGVEGIAELVGKYGNVGATAKTVVGYAHVGGVEFFEGSVRGKIVKPRGKGFGWDPIFQPEGFDKTFGEVTSDEKNEVSMRRIALEKLKDFLR